MQKLYTMKILVFAALIVSVVGGPIVKTWRIDEMSNALYTGSGDVDPEIKPYVEEAYTSLVLALFASNFTAITRQVVPSPRGLSRWTMDELYAAMKDPNTNPNYLPAISKSYEYLKNTHEVGEEPLNDMQILYLAMDISTWTLSDLTEAIANPETNPELIPYLENARNKLTSYPEYQNKSKITIVTKLGLIKPDPNLVPTLATTKSTDFTESTTNEIIVSTVSMITTEATSSNESVTSEESNSHEA